MYCVIFYLRTTNWSEASTLGLLENETTCNLLVLNKMQYSEYRNEETVELVLKDLKTTKKKQKEVNKPYKFQLVEQQK